MRALIGLLYFSAVLALLVAAMLSIHSDPAFHQPARLAAGPLVLLCAVLAWLRPNGSRPPAPRHGLLTAEDRPPLSEGERERLLGETLRRAARLIEDDDLSEAHPRRTLAAEVFRLAEAWTEKHGAPLSDDELRSLYQLWRYADPGDRPTSQMPEQYLRDVRDPEPFARMRDHVQAWRARKPEPDEAFQDWLRHVGDPSMNHLLQMGWVHFLESLPGSDQALWHAVATDFDDIDESDRLEALFWILEQPECDRATASDAIRGVVYWRVLDRLARDAERPRYWQLIKRYREAILRYNDGFYTRHGLTAAEGEDPGPDFDEAAMARSVARVVRETGIPRLPRPKGLFWEATPPADRVAAGYRAPYGYDPGAGLYLRYPGPGWRNAS